jgi:hypothetical protein
MGMGLQMGMTLREALRTYYPQHCQRVIECIHEQTPDLVEDYLSIWVDSRTVALSKAFIWWETEEGWFYWAKLAGMLQDTSTVFGHLIN